MRFLVQRHANANTAGSLGQCHRNPLVHAALDEQPRPGRTGLSGRSKRAMERNSRRLGQVGIGKNNMRRFTATFKRTALQVDAGTLHNLLGGAMVTGKGNLVDSPMRNKGRAGDITVSREHVDDARRKTRLLY